VSIALVGRSLARAKSREVVPAQPVDATPSAISHFFKGGVYDI